MGCVCEELQSTVSNIVDIAVCFDESGVDLYFLNREPVLSVKSSTEARPRRRAASVLTLGPAGKKLSHGLYVAPT